MRRLIDPTELKAAISVSAMLEDRKHIFDIIDEQPTIEPERKHGRWNPNPEFDKEAGHGYFVCSACGSEWYDVNGYVFCPNCGARMEDTP